MRFMFRAFDFLHKCRASAFWAIAMASIAILGCSSSDGADPTADSTTASLADVAVVPDATRSESTSDAAESEQLQVIRVTASNYLIPDPAVDDSNVALSNSYDLQREIYAGLVAVVDDPAAPFQPDLAANWDISNDGKTYTFALRPGLKFSDGSPLTASDFKWSWERALNLATDSSIATFGNIVGADSMLADSRSDLRGLDAVDDETLRVALSSPDPYWLAKVASPAAFVLKRDNVERWSVDWRHWSRPGVAADYAAAGEVLPVGAGPFALSVFEFGNRYELVRNDHYHGTRPFLDRVEYVVNIGVGQHLARFDAGDLDILRTDAQTLGDRVDAGVLDDVLTISGSYRLAYMAFNAGVYPYDDHYFRKALVAASGFDRGTSITDPRALPSGSAGVDAAELIQRSKYAAEVEDIELTFHEWVQGAFQNQFEAMATSWGNVIGVSARYRPVFVAQYEDLLADGKIEIVFGFATPSHPGRAAIIEELAGIFPNRSESTELRDLDMMIEEASLIVDRAERETRYSEIAAFLKDQALILPLFWIPSETRYMVRPGLKGLADPPFGGSRFVGVWLDSA